MSDKGNVYWCTWEKNTDGDYVGWPTKRPSLRAEGMTESEMVDALADVVGEYHNDREAVLQFEPPLESENGSAASLAREFVSVGWNSHFRLENPNDVFSGGKCDKCSWGIGERTPEPLRIKSLWPGSDGLFLWDPLIHAHIYVVSDVFLKLLTKEEAKQFDIRPVILPSKRRRKLFEILPKLFLSEVAIKGVEVEGWHCSKCGHRHMWFTGANHGLQVVCRADLPSPEPKIFFVGQPNRYELCLRISRFAELREMAGTRQMLKDRVAMVDQAECVRRPKLPTREEREQRRRRR
jgi:hypothetical protein